MKKFEKFSIRRPIIFGFILVVLYSLLSTLTWPVTQLYPYPEGNEWGGLLAKIIIAACFVGLTWRFGWLEFAGYRHFGSKRIWLIVIPLILYKAILSVYVFAGKFSFSLPPLSLSLAIITYALATALLEESIARGLLLPAMRKAWGRSPKGLILSALISGFFWASLHLFNLIIRPFPVVLMQGASMALVGFYYAIFTILGRSIWPAVMFHWVINTTINLALSSNPNFEETVTHHLGYAVISLLPLLVSLWLLKPIRRNYETHPATLP